MFRFAGNSQFLSSSPLSRTDFSPKEGPVEHTKETQFVMFRGSLVDLASLLDKLEGSDKSSAQLGSQLTDVSCQLGERCPVCVCHTLSSLCTHVNVLIGQ